MWSLSVGSKLRHYIMLRELTIVVLQFGKLPMVNLFNTADKACQLMVRLLITTDHSPNHYQDEYTDCDCFVLPTSETLSQLDVWWGNGRVWNYTGLNLHHICTHPKNCRSRSLHLRTCVAHSCISFITRVYMCTCIFWHDIE